MSMRKVCCPFHEEKTPSFCFSEKQERYHCFGCFMEGSLATLRKQLGLEKYDELMAESAWIKEEVWNSITPALAVTDGSMWLLSTPWLRTGFYYDCFKDIAFTSFHQSSEDCPRITEEFLERMKKRFSKAKYNQMYRGEWLDDAARIFDDEWIDKVCILPVENRVPKNESAFGIDVAGTGDDESTYEGLISSGKPVSSAKPKISSMLVNSLHAGWSTFI